MMLLAKASGTDAITLVIAVVGLAFAAASLAWQAATFALTGSRVKAKILRGVEGGGMLVTYPPDKWDAKNLAYHASQGMPNEVVVVEVRNVGRLPVTVERFTLYLENGVGLAPQQQTVTPLPFRLEGGSSEKWWVESAAVRAAIAASKATLGLKRSEVHIAVDLGTGKTVKTKKMAF